MKKIIAIMLSIILAMAITLPAAAVSTVAVKSISLDNNRIALTVGQTYNLKVTLTPANTTQKLLTYVTANKNVATVDKDGKITAVKAGTAVIQAYSASNKNVLAKCSVTVSKLDYKGKTLNVYAFEGGFGIKYLDSLITSFKKEYPGVNVKLTSSPQISDLIKPMFLAGNPPDFYDCAEIPDKYALDGALLELSDVYYGKLLDKEALFKDIYPDGLIEFNQPLKDGKIYSLYSTVGVSGVWYNSTYFKKMGWTAPTTIAEFYALGEKAKAAGKSLYVYQGLYPSYNDIFLWPLIASAAGPAALKKIENYEEGAWTDPNVKKALQVMADIAEKGYLMPGTTGINHTQAQTDFLNGKALFCPNGTWFANEMKDAIPKEGFSWGFIPGLKFNASDKAYVGGGGGGYFVIPKQAKNPELAKEFLKYNYTEMAVKLRAGMNGDIAAVKGAVDMAKPYIDSSIYAAFKTIDTYPAVSRHMTAVTTKVNWLSEAYDPITSIMNKTMTVDEWAAKMEKADAQIREDMKK